MNHNAKAKREFPYVTLILVVTLVLVVAIVGYALVDTLGIVAHLNKAAESDNFKLNENHVDVYRYHSGKSMFTNYFYYIKYYGLTDPFGTAQYFGSNQIMEYVYYNINTFLPTGQFDESAYSYAEQYLTYCEGAKEAGLFDQYMTDTAADVDEYIENEKEMAKQLGVTFGSYMKRYMGDGVSEKDLREAMEYYFVGIEYAEKLQEDYENAATIKDIETFRDENKGDFYTSKYTSYKLVNNEMKDKFKECKTVEDVKTAIVDYYIEKNYDTQYKKNFEGSTPVEDADKDQTKADIRTTILALNSIGDAKEVFKSSDTEAYKKAAYTVATSINTSAKTEVNKVTEGGSTAYSDPTASGASDLVKWLFAEGRKKGDYNLIETKSTSNSSSTSGSTTTTTSYTWYLVEDVMVLDTELTKDAYYVKLTDDADTVEDKKTAAQKADAMYNELKDIKGTEAFAEKFEELVNKYAAGSSYEVYEAISEKSIESTNADLAEWLYDDKRAEGDLTRIDVKKGGSGDDKDTVTACFIAYFVEENEETWKLNGRQGWANEQVTDWYEAAVEKYHVTVDFEFATEAPTEAKTESDKATSADKGTAAATEATTEAGTTAGTEAATEAGTEAA